MESELERKLGELQNAHEALAEKMGALVCDLDTPLREWAGELQRANARLRHAPDVLARTVNRYLGKPAGQLRRVHQALRESRQKLAAERNAAEHLQQAATQLIGVRGTDALYGQILDSALAILHADFASIQEFCAERGASGELKLLGHRGLNADVVARWAWVTPETCTACGEALRTGRRVIVPDVRACGFMQGTEDLEGYLGSGIRSALTLPLISRSSALLGMVTAYWRDAHEPSASELRSFDVLARLAADLVEHSHVEEARRENAQRLRTIYDTVRDVIFQVAVEPNGQFRFVSVNASFLRVTRLSQEMVVGKTVDEVIPEPSLTLVLSKYRQAVEQGTTVLWEETSDYPGGRLTGEVAVAPVFDGTGTCTHLVGSVHDITMRKRAEQRFAALLEAAPDAMVVVDHEGKIALTNAQVEKLFGYQRTELLGKGIEILVPERFRANHAGYFRKFLDAPKTQEEWPGQELYGLHKDGREFPVESCLSLLETEEGMLVISAIRDITERRRAQAALLDSELRLRRAERLAHIGHWDWDIENDRVHWSEEIYRILGRQEGFVPSVTNSYEIIAPQDRDRAAQWVRECVASKQGGAIELQVRQPNGELRTLSLISELVFDKEGHPLRLFGSCQDITEFRRAQQESFARQKLESVGTLASGIAHDFNNLLGAILAYADLALSERAAGAVAGAELEKIRSLASTGSEIVRQLMIYAGKESGEVGLVDVSRIVKEMLELLKLSISKRAALETDLASRLPPIKASAAQIRQIVMNLVTNASDALEDRDGVIRVTTRHLRHDSHVQLGVMDTGRGMDPEIQTKVFDPFFTTKAAGHGLGLAVVQGTVSALGGTISLASAPDRGTRFQILLPCAEADAGENVVTPPAIEPAEAALSGTALLIVDDATTLRTAVAKMLRKAGLEVLEAGDGTSAIDLLRSSELRIDAMLLDATLPGASSLEVLEEAGKVRPHLQVLMTSAYSQEAIEETMQSPQVRGFIRKPFPFDELMQVLMRTLAASADDKLQDAGG